jgi:uncharacterized protein HemX
VRNLKTVDSADAVVATESPSVPTADKSRQTVDADRLASLLLLLAVSGSGSAAVVAGSKERTREQKCRQLPSTKGLPAPTLLLLL